MRRLTLLSGPVSPLPSRARRWLAAQDGYVAVEVLDPVSHVAARRYPDLVKQPLQDLVAISDGGAVWTGPAAWITTLWALRSTRADALRYSHPRRRAGARARLLALADAESTAREHDGPSGLDVLCVLAWVAGTLLLGAFNIGLGMIAGTVALVLGMFGGLRLLTRATLGLAILCLAMCATWAKGLSQGILFLAPALLLVVLCAAIRERTPPRPPRPYDRLGREPGPRPPRGPAPTAPSGPAPLFEDSGTPSSGRSSSTGA